jgi:hypothetical protein
VCVIVCVRARVCVRACVYISGTSQTNAFILCICLGNGMSIIQVCYVQYIVLCAQIVADELFSKVELKGN